MSYPVGRCRLAALLAALAWLAAAAACLAWSLQVDAPGWQRGAAGGLLLLAAALAWRDWRASPLGTLAWDGARWQWQSGTQPASGRIARALDLQRWLLLHWTGDAGPRRWLWLERDRSPPHWEALRRAVYSRARTEAPSAAQSPTAEP